MKAIKYFALSILLLSALGQLLAQTCLHEPPLKNLKAADDSRCLEANGYYVHSVKFSPPGEKRIDYAIDIAENETRQEELIPFKKNFDVNNSIATVIFALILVYFFHSLKKRLAFHRHFAFFRSAPRFLILKVVRI